MSGPTGPDDFAEDLRATKRTIGEQVREIGSILARLVDLSNLVRDNTPVGRIAYTAAAAASPGWLLCDGSAVSRTTYAALYAALGGASSPYGQGNGTTTFNLPNVKGREIVGVDPAQTEFNARGKTGGAKTHTLTVAELASHTHVQNAHTHTQDPHNHSQNSHNHSQNPHSHSSLASRVRGDGSYNLGVSSGSARSFETDVDINSATASNNSTTATNNPATAVNDPTTATNQNAGGGAAHNNLGPYIAFHAEIKY